MTDMEQISTDARIAEAQELLSVATRNYYVKAYADAVDDFSTVCQTFSEIYGPSAEELGKPYLMYAKCLIALEQEENKVMEIPEEGEEEDDDDDDDGAAEEGQTNGEEAPAASSSATATNGTASDAGEAQPGTSTGITKSERDGEAADVDGEEEDDVGNLQVAWEVLELAVGIFSRLPERKRELATSYSELAGISFENSNFEAAVKDYKKALDVLLELPEKNNRELAEINYKVGLAYKMMNMFEEAKIALMKSCCYLEEEAKGATEDDAKELKETKAEIESKIVEVEEYKQQSMDVVKQELAKLVGHQDNFDVAAGEGTSSKPAANISHLIKRKKPEEGEGGSSAAANNISHLVKRKKDD